MEIEYDLTEADMLALTQFRLGQKRGRDNPVLVQRLAYLAGFALAALGTWLLWHAAVLSVSFLALAIISFALYPTYFDWLMRRKVSKTYREPYNAVTLASRTLRASSRGLEVISSRGEIKIKWAYIDNVVLTPTRAFISLYRFPLIVVPKDGIIKGDYQAFVDFCCENFKGGAA